MKKSLCNPLLILSSVASAMGIKVPKEAKHTVATIRVRSGAMSAYRAISMRAKPGWRKAASRRHHAEIMRRRRVNSRRN